MIKQILCAVLVVVGVGSAAIAQGGDPTIVVDLERLAENWASAFTELKGDEIRLVAEFEDKESEFPRVKALRAAGSLLIMTYEPQGRLSTRTIVLRSDQVVRLFSHD